MIGSLEIAQTWTKGWGVPPNDLKEWRKDACGAWMKFTDYGNRNSQYGWEVDHIVPGNNDALSNLQPLQWENNTAKGDGQLVCAVTASGINNTSKVNLWKR